MRSDLNMTDTKESVNSQIRDGAESEQFKAFKRPLERSKDVRLVFANTHEDDLLRQRALHQIATANPANIQEVAASQLAIINSYYQSGLEQSQQSFVWSLIWGGIGLIFLMTAVGVLLFGQPTEVAFASTIGGALLELFAGTYLVLYKHASDQLAVFRASLERTQRLLLANSMCEQLEGETEKTTRADLIRLMVNSAVNTIENR
jgi:hypothetical protein